MENRDTLLRALDSRLARLPSVSSSTTTGLHEVLVQYEKILELLHHLQKMGSKQAETLKEVESRIAVVSRDKEKIELLIKEGAVAPLALSSSMPEAGTTDSAPGRISEDHSATDEDIVPFLHNIKPMHRATFTSISSASPPLVKRRDDKRRITFSGAPSLSLPAMTKLSPTARNRDTIIGASRTGAKADSPSVQDHRRISVSSEGRDRSLGKLQSLLKVEELSGSVEKRVMKEVGGLITTKSQQMHQLLWESRNLECLLNRVLNNHVHIKTLGDIDIVSDTQPTVKYVQPDSVGKKDLEMFVSILRVYPSVLADTLASAGYLSLEQDRALKLTHNELSQAVVFSLFGNCMFPTDERLFLRLLHKITEQQLASLSFSSTPGNLFGRSESFALSMLTTYINCTYGKPFLIATFKDLVAQVADKKVVLESDPHRQAVLSSRTISRADFSLDAHSLLQRFAAMFVNRITSQAEAFPYGMRWFTRIIVDMCHTESMNREGAYVGGPEWQILCHVIIEGYIVPAIIRPEHHGIVSGAHMTHTARNNLIKIARMVLEWFTDPACIPEWVCEEFNCRASIQTYFENLSDVEDLREHFGMSEEEPGEHQILASTTDLVWLVELVYQNYSNDASLKDIKELIKSVQPLLSSIREGAQFLVVDVSQASAAMPDKKGKDNAEAGAIKLAKQNLHLSLLMLDTLCGSYNSPLDTLLLVQCGRMRSIETRQIAETQIRETVRTLKALPQHYTDDNWAHLLSEMFDDTEKRCKQTEKSKKAMLSALSAMDRHIEQLLFHKGISTNMLTNLKFKEFRTAIYEQLQYNFKVEFLGKFPAPSIPCNCSPSVFVEEAVVCTECVAKVQAIKEFLKTARDAVVNSSWWKNSNQEEVGDAVRTIERDLHVRLYDRLFSLSQASNKFSEQVIEKGPKLSYRQLLIPDKYSAQVPWQLAQDELSKINIYRCPQDKVKCIINCWNIVLNYMRPFGDTNCGPDEFLPIMGYVILATQTEHLLANVQYVQLYGTLDDVQEVWFVNFLSAIQVVKEALQAHTF
jgi:hypothetical protein